MRRIISIWLLIICVFAVSAAAQQQKTVVRDRPAKARLLGNHRLSLQWISWDYFGRATVTERKGVLRLTGEQKARKGTDYLKIDGYITEISAKQFTFDGKIETRVSHINEGEPCLREGEMTFKITGKRQYWRLQQMLNPCTNVETDYVDIFFK